MERGLSSPQTAGAKPDDAEYHIILVGIDDYHDKENNLQSCVHDVEAIGELLESRLVKVTNRYKMHWLIACREQNHSTCLHPVSFANPTLERFLAVLKQVAEKAQHGAFIYIHFSGHGTSVPPLNDSDFGSGDVGLVFLGDDEYGETPCLEGRVLAQQLKMFTDRRLQVTLVLDCCLSGAINRNNFKTRWMDWKPEMRVDLDRISRPRQTNRGASMFDTWFLDPNAYCLLAACAPGETAYPIFDPESSRQYGALSFFLREAIRRLGLKKSMQVLHAQLSVALQPGVAKKQNPVLYGNSQQCILGPAGPYSSEPEISVSIRGSSIELRVGMIHGVRVGDEFALLAPVVEDFESRGETPSGGSTETSLETKTSGISVTGKVTHLSAFKSIIEVEGRRPRTAWTAVPKLSKSIHEFPIRLGAGIIERQQLEEALRERSLSTNSDNAAYEIAIVSGHYVISDGDGLCVTKLPSLPCSEIDKDGICDILKHLIRFRIFEDLVQVSHPLLSVRVTLNGSDPSTVTEVLHGGKITLCIENEEKKAPIYILIFNLTACWSIAEISTASYLTCDPGQTLRKAITMTIPESLGAASSTSELLKVVITSCPIPFQTMLLPEIGDIPAIHRHKKVVRGDFMEEESWMAINFPIKINR